MKKKNKRKIASAVVILIALAGLLIGAVVYRKCAIKYSTPAASTNLVSVVTNTVTGE